MPALFSCQQGARKLQAASRLLRQTEAPARPAASRPAWAPAPPPTAPAPAGSQERALLGAVALDDRLGLPGLHTAYHRGAGSVCGVPLAGAQRPRCTPCEAALPHPARESPSHFPLPAPPAPSPVPFLLQAQQNFNDILNLIQASGGVSSWIAGGGSAVSEPCLV